MTVACPARISPAARRVALRAAPPTRRSPGRVRLLVLDGRLPLRTRLPGERELAEALGVSRTTATAAYAALRDEGFLASRRGAGSWTRLPADAGAAPAPVRGRRRRRDRPQLRGQRGARGRAARRAGAATAELPRHLPGPGYDAAGLPVLRAAIAAHLTRRGAPTDARPGARHRRRAARADAAAARARPAPATACWSSTRPIRRARRVRAIGARPVPVPMLPDGWDLEMLAATLRQAAPRLAYLIADHQNPTGLTLAARRPRAARRARRARRGRRSSSTRRSPACTSTAATPPAPVAALDPAARP